MSLLCNKNGAPQTIEFYRLSNTAICLDADRANDVECYGGFASSLDGGTTVGIFDIGIMYDILNTRYTLIHELGHILDYRNSQLQRGFLSARTRSGCYSYPFDCADLEAFAEAVTLFVNVPGGRRDLEPFNLATIDRAAYDWINQNIFNNEDIQRTP